MLGNVPRFSIKDLLIGTTLIAIGVVMFCLASDPYTTRPGILGFMVGSYAGGSMFIGAGVFTLFMQSGFGTLIGAIVGYIAFMLFAIFGALV